MAIKIKRETERKKKNICKGEDRERVRGKLGVVVVGNVLW